MKNHVFHRKYLGNHYQAFADFRTAEKQLVKTPFGDYVSLDYENSKHILQSKDFETVDIYRKLLDKSIPSVNTKAIAEAVKYWALFLIPDSQHLEVKQVLVRVWSQIDWNRIVSEEIANAINSLKQEGNSFEAISNFAKPIPTRIIGKALGIPPSDLKILIEWSEALTTIFEPLPRLEAYEKMGKVATNFLNYICDLICSQDKDSLVQKLRFEFEKGSIQLTEKELASIIILLFVAGQETTVNLIGNGLRLLLENEERKKLFEESPSQFIEEVLRYSTPVHYVGRVALKDVTLGELLLPKGSQVFVGLGSANRDESAFENAQEFACPMKRQKHLAFGHGAHFCLGAQLAKKQTVEAFKAILSEFPKLKISDRKLPLSYNRNFILFGLEELWLSKQ